MKGFIFIFSSPISYFPSPLLDSTVMSRFNLGSGISLPSSRTLLIGEQPTIFLLLGILDYIFTQKMEVSGE
jgi:hypothetical protein